MKEIRYFYAPQALQTEELPEDEAMHALRVLRLKGGDEMILMDGCGNYYRAEVTIAATRKCLYKVLETLPQNPQWRGHFNLTIAPTKTMDRMEWMLEKITEIGFNNLRFVNCKNSERRVLKKVRLEKIAVAAMKQSHKAWKPMIHDMIPLKTYLGAEVSGHKYIAHCYDEIPRTYLFDELRKVSDSDEDITVLVGPEGDFTPEEVKMAMDAGFVSVHLGKSRLRTETAGLSSVMMMHLSKD